MQADLRKEERPILRDPECLCFAIAVAQEWWLCFRCSLKLLVPCPAVENWSSAIARGGGSSKGLGASLAGGSSGPGQKLPRRGRLFQARFSGLLVEAVNKRLDFRLQVGAGRDGTLL